MGTNLYGSSIHLNDGDDVCPPHNGEDIMPSLYQFQEQAVRELVSGKHIIVAPCGTGKGAMAMVWTDAVCKAHNKKKIVVVSTASKANMKPTDFEQDMEQWVASLSKSQYLLSVVSWAKFSQWVNAHWSDLDEWVLVADEVQYAKAGISSKRGKAFLKFTKVNQDWAGFSATPGQNWLDFYPYFTACGLVRNKTSFKMEFAIEQTFKGFPEIVGWRNEDKLVKMWKSISYTPDTSEVFAEMPDKTYKTVRFKKPTGYDKLRRTRTTKDGGFLDTTMALMVELRRSCFTKEKQQWLSDYLETLGEPSIMFYNFIKTGDEVESIAKKALPKGAKVWRIDGTHHEIPTADTLGKYDLVLCQWQSGSEGLNMQMIHHWVAVELCYSYSTFLQAKGRIDRIGQNKTMFYTQLVCDDCVDEDVRQCLSKKKDFIEDLYVEEKGL